MNYIRGRALPRSICWMGCWQCAVLAQTSEFGPDVLAEQSSGHDQLGGRQSLLMLRWLGFVEPNLLVRILPFDLIFAVGLATYIAVIGDSVVE